MSALDKAVETQLRNIEKKVGQPLAALTKALKASGLAKHGELRTFAQDKWGLGHGDANAIVHHALASDGASAAKTVAATGGDPLDEIYAGKKAHFRPLHTALMAEIAKFGAFETAPKKGYVALRRKKQFAMLGPKTNDRFELGVNLKDAVKHPLVKAQPPGGMCQYVAAMNGPEQIDASLIAVLRAAYDAAG